MDDEKRPKRSGVFEVGYGRPPVSTRFQKGQSGNPKGRPRGSGRQRINELATAEVYRLVTVREGESTVRIPAIQGILRAMVVQAVKGNGPTQRTLLQLVQELDAIEKQNQPAPPPKAKISTEELANRILFILERAKREKEGS